MTVPRRLDWHLRRNLLSLVGSALIGFIQPAAAQTAFVAGTCNVVNQDIKLGDNAKLIVENNCVADSPEKSYRVRYIWLDAKSVSFIFAGVFDQALDRLFGATPRLVRTGTYNQIAEILQRFGERLTATSAFFGSKYQTELFAKGGPIASEPRAFASLSSSALKKLRIYSGDQEIIWPDLQSTRTITDTNKWPAGYRLTYSVDKESGTYAPKFFSANDKDAHNSVFACTILYAAVTKSAFDNYWESIGEVEGYLEKPGRLSDPYVNAIFKSLDFKSAAIQHPSYEAMRYFTTYNWPEDFLFAFGNFTTSGCGSGQFGFYALPRSLFVQFAVVESTAKSLSVSGLSFDVDPTLGLRDTVKLTEAETLPLAGIQLGRGESLLIPLRIELRYDKTVRPISAVTTNGESVQIYKGILGAPVSTFVFFDNFGKDAKEFKRIDKLKSEFRSPVFRDVTQTYYFGKSSSLKAVSIDGKNYDARPAPPSALVMNGFFEEGSCPFLAFRMSDGELSSNGRILVGADTPSLARTDEVAIPTGSRAFRIIEREPERTRISRIALRDSQNGDEILVARSLILRAREGIEFDLPASYARFDRLQISGYYERLDPKIADVGPR